jgi:UDP-N-acetylglucosamine--N-acetylmuramyl-(pentapeptide) pyrophosphoryl-undecaprenol N-acetylglucosamine transferase
MKNNIVFTGGGTGGHTICAFSFIEFFKENFDADFFYIGSRNGLEKEIVKKYDFVNYFEISTGKFRRSLSLKNITDFFSFLKGIFEAKKILENIKPKFVFSTGGYVSLPVVIASYIKGIDIIVHEQTSVPGLANSIAFRLSKINLLTFENEDIKIKNSYVVGNPVRKSLKKKVESEIEKKRKCENPVLFVTGGANGSALLNEFVFNEITWLSKNFKIYHQIGKNSYNIEKFEGRARNIKSENYEYSLFFEEDKLSEIYASDPVLLCRSGAGQINDIIHFKLVSTLVPLKNSARDEQLKNALYLYEKNAANLILEDRFKSVNLKRSLMNMYINAKKLKKNLEKIKGFDEEKFKNLIKNIFTT